MSRPGQSLWTVQFGKILPFVGIGEISKMHLEPHEYLEHRKAGVEFGTNPWNENKSTLVTIERDGTPIALISPEGSEIPSHDKLDGQLFDVHLSGPRFGYGTYTIDIEPKLTPSQIAKVIGNEEYKLDFKACPEIFSIVPLEVKYTFVTEGSLNEVPAIVGDRLLMDGRLSKVSNGVINVPAGQITDLGPLLQSVISRQRGDEKYMITRRLTLSIRMLSYGG
ncbi:MAG: hypothetical protein CL961_00155 [Euryarchaeota archaeon]|nr:hypothetical protein [Euryarchaeota archaeon]|tara:strand:- start:116 stop:781 length:666 start_codon:yes stop_codon:yes gene_type:complete